MKVVEHVLGNLEDGDWRQRVEGGVIATLLLDEWERQKPRLRRRASDGAEVAINLDRGASLQDGDILDWDPATRRAIVVKVRAKEVMHIQLEPAEPAVMIERALKLGHVLGNQHWPALVKGTSIYVPLHVDRKVMATVLKTHSIPGVSHEFIPGEGFSIPHVAHDHGHSHEHSHSHGHGHGHSHGHEHSHSGEAAASQ